MGRLSPTILLLACFITVANADYGDAFADKLSEGIASTFTFLFERFTTQHLAQSLVFHDYVAIAASPIDITLVAISAIRVGGPPWLKAVVGRAAEATAAVEQELMSSNREVCEVWNGRDVVRRIGAGLVREFVCLYPGKEVPKNAVIKVMSMAEAVANGYMKLASDTKQGLWQKVRALLPFAVVDQDDQVCETGSRENIDAHQDEVVIISNVRPESPNISLNRSNNTGTQGLYCACVGVLLKVGEIAFAYFMTYYHQNHATHAYAFPLFTAGTVLVCLGTGVNASVVGSSTKEEYFQPAKAWAARMVWLQKKTTLSDQDFRSTALFTGVDQPTIITSSRIINQNQDSDNIQRRLTVLTYIGLMLTLVGFVAQLVGLESLHRSVRIVSLAAASFMMAVRVWACRARTNPIVSRDLTPGFELDWLAVMLGNPGNAPWMRSRNELASGPSNESLNGAEGSSDGSLASSDADEAQACTKLRQSLAKLANWRSPVVQEATQLTEAMEAAMDRLHNSCDCRDFIWADKVQVGKMEELEVKFKMSRRPDGKWKSDAGEVEAALSLMVFSATPGNEGQIASGSIDADAELPLERGDTPSKRIRILGPHTNALLQHLSWWTPADGPRIRVGQVEYVTAEEGAHSIGARTQRSHVVGNMNEFHIRQSNVVGFDPRQGKSPRAGQGATVDAVSLPSRVWPYSARNERRSFDLSAQRTPTLVTEEGNSSTNGGPECSGTAFSYPFQLSSPYSTNSGHGKWKFKASRRENLQLPAEDSNSVLFVESFDSLPVFYAKDMLATFIWAAMEALKSPVQGTTSTQGSETGEPRDPGKQFHLTNSDIDGLAQGIHGTGLLSERDAHLSILVPLAMQSKLPDAPSPST
ncbi:hypothetical protein J3F83DRAFT_769497 [Trichoderma novae-zelandiae]